MYKNKGRGGGCYLQETKIASKHHMVIQNILKLLPFLLNKAQTLTKNELIYVFFMSPTHIVRKLEIGQQKLHYICFHILFDQVHFKVIEILFMQYLRRIKKNWGPKRSTLTFMLYDYVMFSRIFPPPKKKKKKNK